MKEFQYYLDMDQCLTDFRGHFEDIYKIHPKDYRLDPNNTEEDYLSLIEAKGVEFWSEMKWMPDGKKWWQYIHSKGPIKIISYPLDMPGCKPGKLEWCERELGIDPEDVILTQEKHLFCNKYNDLLIDDTVSNLSNWRRAGGQAIQHTTAQASIDIVEALRANTTNSECEGFDRQETAFTTEQEIEAEEIRDYIKSRPVDNNEIDLDEQQGNNTSC